VKLNAIQRMPNGLEVTWQDHLTWQFPYLWLRDNSPQDRTANGQRLIETVALNPQLTLDRAELTPEGDLQLTWDGQVHTYPATWLRAYAEPDPYVAPRRLWRAEQAASLKKHRYTDILASPAALHAWLKDVEVYGVAFLTDVPSTDEAIFEVTGWFGYVRETNYGRVFDVKSVINPNNLAFTGHALSVHTDNPYRVPVPSLQLLHCLANSVAGGESILVDGFCVAEALRQSDPAAFDILSQTRLRFHFHDEHTDLSSWHSLIQLGAEGEVEAIRYNNRSLAPLHRPDAHTLDFYRAYQAFGRLLQDPTYAFQFKMEAGDLFIVDNERVLHGRTGFTSDHGERHLRGCYAERADLLSRLRVLERHIQA